MATQISSISQALAGNLETIKIPKPTNLGTFNADLGHDYDEGSRTSPKGGSPGDLLTPPNSISPTIPVAFRNRVNPDAPGYPPSVDSDIDLQDAMDQSNDKSEEEADSADTAHITPQYLAKHHIANYILEKGPIAVRHVMNHLSATVPGYGKIPPPKARRITVAALESKAGGGTDGNVEFEKVGWGRWDAKRRGQLSRETRAMYSIREDNFTPPPAAVPGPPVPQPSQALQIPGGGRDRRRSKSRRMSYGSWAGESTLARSVTNEQQDDDFGDVMSIDGDEDASKSAYKQVQARRSPYPELSSDTEEEDWSTLEATSYNHSFLGTSGPGRSSRFLGTSGPGSRSRSRGWSPYPNSLPTTTNNNAKHISNNKTATSQLDYTGVDMNPQELDAISALLKLGSV